MFNKVVLIDFKDGDIPQEYFERLKNSMKAFVMVSRDSALNEIKDADAILVTISTKVDRELIDAAPELKYIGVCATAFDAVDTQYAREKNIDVCNLGGYSTEAVAEFAVAALLEQIRSLRKAQEQAKEEDYSFSNFMGEELKSKTLGVIGAGQIGGRIAEIASGFGMNIKYFSRTEKTKLDSLGAKKSELDDILQSSDYIALALSLNDQTRGILSKEKLAIIRKGCVLVNIAPMELLDK
jgi:lactate dehydrogenase-like 2-hydroxyacid dehydrogenase